MIDSEEEEVEKEVPEEEESGGVLDLVFAGPKFVGETIGVLESDEAKAEAAQAEEAESPKEDEGVMNSMKSAVGF